MARSDNRGSEGKSPAVDVAQKTPVEDLFQELKSSKTGLSDEEAAGRLEQYGPNEITEKKTSPLRKFLGYFWGPIPWMIEAAAILSALIHRWEDFWIIFILLMLNAGVGFWQEYKADNAIDLLKRKLAPTARVRRSGRWRKVNARELVPGDVVRVRLGDIVPADIKLFEGDYLQVDQSRCRRRVSPRSPRPSNS